MFMLQLFPGSVVLLYPSSRFVSEKMANGGELGGKRRSRKQRGDQLMPTLVDKQVAALTAEEPARRRATACRSRERGKGVRGT